MSGTARFILLGGLLLGGAAIIGLIAWTGAREVATALARGGSALPWLILVHGGQIRPAPSPGAPPRPVPSRRRRCFASRGCAGFAKRSNCCR
jgi:hypothetical protein